MAANVSSGEYALSKPKRKATRARIDNGDVRPRTLADRVYSNEFLARLATRFKFELTSAVERELRHMAFVYIVHRRDDGSEDPWRRERKRFLKLHKTVQILQRPSVNLRMMTFRPNSFMRRAERRSNRRLLKPSRKRIPHSALQNSLSPSYLCA